MKDLLSWEGACLLFISIIAGFGAAGATKKAMTEEVVSKKDIKVEHLFTKDGCDVYRFNDKKVYHYAKCSDGTAEIVK